MTWKRMLAYVTGSVDEELLLRNEYLVTENRLLRNQIKGRLRLTDPERISLADIGQRLGRKALAEVAQMVRPETILGWHRKLIARKLDGSKHRSPANRGSTGKAIEDLVLRFARENRTWGYRRIVGALSNLGHEVSHQTVANVLKRHGLAPAPEREKKMSWREFIRSHTEVLAAVDFFTTEVWTLGGLITYYVLTFISAVEDDPVRGAIPAALPGTIPFPLPRRTEPPREGQRDSLSPASGPEVSPRARSARGSAWAAC
jgi:transposase